MPQNENLSKTWKLALGAEWKRIRDTWLHTLGNLTLTAYNSEYSDRSFIEKRDMKGGFKESPLYLNKGIGQLDKWDEEKIKARAQRLSATALLIWCAPQMATDVLDLYRPQKESTSGYSIKSHPFLLSGVAQELFTAFRKEVLALDPVVSEEFLKLYVAYKAESNFVDIVPLSKQLRLYLNMPFADISDPLGICKDLTNFSHWGNGDIEVALTSLEELPYIMGLVHQSFERQMGNGSEG